MSTGHAKEQSAKNESWEKYISSYEKSILSNSKDLDKKTSFHDLLCVLSSAHINVAGKVCMIMNDWIVFVNSVPFVARMFDKLVR